MIVDWEWTGKDEEHRRNYFFIFLVGTIILFFVTVCNYLIAYGIKGEHLTEAYINNPYVGYWVNLFFVFSV